MDEYKEEGMPTGRARGRPRIESGGDAKQKKRERDRLNIKLAKLLKEGKFEEYIDIAQYMQKQKVVGPRAMGTLMNNLIKARGQTEYEPGMEKEVGFPLETIEESVAALLEKEKTMVNSSVSSASTEKSSDLSQHFTSYFKEAEDPAPPVKEARTMETQTEMTMGTRPMQEEAEMGGEQMDPQQPKLDFDELHTVDFKHELRQALAHTKTSGATYDEIKNVFDNFLTPADQERVRDGEITLLADRVEAAELTAQFVPNYLEGNEQMTKEERQHEFHRALIAKRLETVKDKPRKNNFDRQGEMAGGIDAGLEVQTEEDEQQNKDYIHARVYQDYEFLLDSKLMQNAEARELAKGVDPDTLFESGLSAEDIQEFYANMLKKNNEQDRAELDGALADVEVLSGGNKDSLFNQTDLTGQRRGGRLLAPVERGVQAGPIEEVDREELDEYERGVDQTIAYGIGTLANVFHSKLSEEDMLATRSNSEILQSIDQNIRLMGKRSMFATDDLKKSDPDFTGTTFEGRMKSLRDFNNERKLGRKNPNMLQRDEGPEGQGLDQEAMMQMMKAQAGKAQGASLQQLREQEFGYKQADRKTAHDGYSFIKGGKATAIKLQQEFDP